MALKQKPTTNVIVVIKPTFKTDLHSLACCLNESNGSIILVHELRLIGCT